MKIFKSLWELARYGVLLVLIGLITISSHPRIMDISHSEGIQTGTFLSRYIILVFGVLFVLYFSYLNSKTYLKSRTLVVSWVAEETDGRGSHRGLYADPRLDRRGETDLPGRQR